MVKVRSKPRVKKPDETLDKAIDLLKSLANHYYIRDDRTMCEFAIELLHIHYERKFESFDIQLDGELNADAASDAAELLLE